MNMSLTERARCLKLKVGLPKSFWAETVSMACYLINRSPRASLGATVAEEVWTGNPIDFDHLRIFGCSTYVHVPSDERSKLDLKSKQCIFLGYKKGVKCYKFWDPVARKMMELELHPVATENHGSSHPTSGGSTTNERQAYNLARDRQRRTNVKPPSRLGSEDMVSFAFLISGDEPTTFHGAIIS
ncbi:UNVERIFIED_CONTAM: hypothetical protein Sangu_0186100 [Sesamum angustifolium]|uniref:Retroviral polymerase SH3-like domain-containing protein n=1 Tax=Sesamum angustifolium TaxID=2727405 RepID=A0AAW2RMT5_9LAMI